MEIGLEGGGSRMGFLGLDAVTRRVVEEVMAGKA